MRRFNVLFLCTGNSARSILGEAIANSVGQGRFAGYSAGSRPSGAVHPLALDLLHQMQLPTDLLRSKSWDEFAVAGAPTMDFIFTVCDNAAGETCPIWPGQPMTAHWGVPDPASVAGTEVERWRAFRQTFAALETASGCLPPCPSVRSTGCPCRTGWTPSGRSRREPRQPSSCPSDQP